MKSSHVFVGVTFGLLAFGVFPPASWLLVPGTGIWYVVCCFLFRWSLVSGLIEFVKRKARFARGTWNASA